MPETVLNAAGNYRDFRCDEDGNACAVPPLSGLPLMYFLTSAGNGTGEINLIGNYAAAVTDFYYLAPAGYRYRVYTVQLCIADASLMNQVDYGAIAGGLTNGLTIWIRLASGVELPLLGGMSVKTNQHFLNLTRHTMLTQFPGVPQSFVVSFPIWKDHGMPITLEPGDRFIARLHDDYTPLVSHTFLLRGIRSLV